MARTEVQPCQGPIAPRRLLSASTRNAYFCLVTRPFDRGQAAVVGRIYFALSP